MELYKEIFSTHFIHFCFGFVQPIFSYRPLCDGRRGIVNNISKNNGLIDNWRVPLLTRDVGGKGLGGRSHCNVADRPTGVATCSGRQTIMPVRARTWQHCGNTVSGGSFSSAPSPAQLFSFMRAAVRRLLKSKIR